MITAQVADDIFALCDKLWEFDKSCIINVDRMGLIFKLRPFQTLIYSCGDISSGRVCHCLLFALHKNCVVPALKRLR